MSRGFGSTFGVASTDKITINSYVQPSIFTFSIWLYRNGTGGGGGGRIFDQTNTLSAIFVSGGGTTIAFVWFFSGSSGTWTFTLPSTGVWHHLCIVYDATNTSNVPIIYIDGVAQTLSATQPTGTVGTQNGPPFLGNRTDGTRNWDGLMAHFAQWNNQLLTASEVSALSSGVNPLMLYPEKLTYYTPLDGVNNPEVDIIKGYITTLSGTALGRSEAPVMSVAQAWYTIFDDPINIPGIIYNDSVTESVIANDNYIDANVITVITQTGSGADSWQKYLNWLEKKKKSEFKKKAARVGIKEVAAVKMAEIAASEVRRQEPQLKQPFYAYIDENEQTARGAAQAAIIDIYDEVWRQMAVQKKDISALKFNINAKQREEEEEDIFLMVM